MADVKISQLPAATTPVDGTEVLPIVQSATTKQVSIANLTAGRAMSASSMTLTTPLAVTSGGTGIATAAEGALLSATAVNTFSATRTPTLGLAGTAAGTLGLSGSTSGVVTLATAAAAGTWTFTLPTSGGSNGWILTTNGSGVSTWTNPTALGVDLDVGTTAITGGTTGRVLYNNAGVLGEYAITGTGSVVLGTSPTFTTSAIFPAGTVGAPGITTTGDTNTGIYFPAADTIGFVEGGTESMRLDASGTLRIIGAGSSGSPAVSFSGSAVSNSMVLDASGQLTVGSTSSSGLPITAFKLMASNNDATTGIGIVRFGTTYGSNLYHTYSTTLDAGAEAFGITVCETTALTDKTRTKYLVNQNGIHAWYGPTTSTERMRIDSSGNLLVGTTTAFGRFVVRSSSTTVIPGWFSTNASGDVGLEGIRVDKFDNNTTTSQVFVRFSVNNNATASGQINANGASAAAFGTWSDQKLKENIVDLPSQLLNILSLRPREFDYRDGSGHQVGFVAQEMQKVYPDVVAEGDGGMLTITGWSKTEARLVKAIQELAAEVAELKSKVQ